MAATFGKKRARRGAGRRRRGGSRFAAFALAGAALLVVGLVAVGYYEGGPRHTPAPLAAVEPAQPGPARVEGGRDGRDAQRRGATPEIAIPVPRPPAGLAAAPRPSTGLAAPRPPADIARTARPPQPSPDRIRTSAVPRPPVDIPSPARGVRVAGVSFPLCGRERRVTCVVDGDTFYFKGEKIRVADIDTPEIGQPKCRREADLGARATRRFQQLLNAGPLEIRAGARDEDRYGRKLRTVHRDGRSLGDTLVGEGLAHRWGGRKQSWCG